MLRLKVATNPMSTASCKDQTKSESSY